MTAVTGDGTAMGGLGGPAGFGETMLARADDGSLQIDGSAVFQDGIRLGSTTYAADQLFVSTNGLVSFGAAFSGVADGLEAIPMPFIAAFHADVDTRLDGEGAESGPVWVDVDPARDVVTITWQEVGFYRRDARLTNTFQLQLYDQGDAGFDIVLRYDSVGWTSGALQGGWNGTGGAAALVGWGLGGAPVSHWASGDEGRLLALPGQVGNTGIAGLWVVRHHPHRVVSGAATPELLEGSAGPDQIYGGAGNDTLRGGAGADQLEGGTGFDLADYSLSPQGVTIHLLDPALNGGGDAQGDTLVGIEGLIGSPQGDRLSGDHGDNSLDGGAGNDTLFANGGSDLYFGGAGWDRLDFAAATSGIRLDLETPALSSGDAAGDVLDGIEEIAGSSRADTLAGAAGADVFHGAGGDDRIEGRAGADRLFGGVGDDVLFGGAGADRLAGGAGRDMADHASAAGSIWADLRRPARNRGEAAGDTYRSVENLAGSAQDDQLWGNRGGNLLLGRAGNDRLVGRAGRDTLLGDEGDDILQGGAGADLIDGGAGRDRLSYAGHARAVRVDLLQPDANRGAAMGDRISGIEIIEGTARADTLAGDGQANTLLGGKGADLLEGRGGADQLFGGQGFDLASYQGATAAVVVDLARPELNRGEAAGDRLFSIEGLIGSPHDDVLRGNAGPNRLAGGLGRDTLQGGAGADSFVLSRLDEAGDVVLDYRPAQGDTLVLALEGLTGGDLAVRIDTLPGLGAPDRAEALVIHRPTGTTLFTLVDAEGLTDLFALLGSTRFDLL